MARRSTKTVVEDDTITTVEAEEGESKPAKLRPKLGFDGFLQKLAGLTPDDAPVIYINRISPKIDIALSGRKFKYLEKIYSQPADLRGYIKQNHGGGKYDLLLNAENRAPSPVAQTVLEIPLNEAEPILDPVELVRGEPEVEQLIKRWHQNGKIAIGPDGQVQRSAATAEAAPGQAAPTNPLMDMVLKKALDVAFDGPKQPSMVEIIAAMKASGGDQQQTQFMQFMMQQLTAAQTQNTALLTQMLEAKTRPSGANSLDQTITTLEKLSSTFGIKAGSESHSWVKDVIQLAPAIVGPLVGAFMALKGVGAPAPGSAAQPGGAAPTEATATPAAPTVQDLRMAELRRFTVNIIDASFVDIAGEADYQRVISMGAPTIKATLFTFPDLSSHLLALGERLDNFIEAFCHAYDPDQTTEEPAA